MEVSQKHSAGAVKDDRSYRALLMLPGIARLMLGMQLARLGQAMVSIALVLYCLDAYHSSRVAGMATFLWILPGLLLSPIAGALLDRHGRTRLVVLDYVIALASLVLIGVLAKVDALPSHLLLLIAGIASITSPLSMTGLRSLLPLIVPSRLWERVNALDSIGYVTATIVGPAIAATLVARWSGAVAFIVIGASFGLAAIVIARTPDPRLELQVAKPLFTEAWHGLRYTWRNPTLRGLGICVSVANIINGAFTIIVPLLIIDRFHLAKTAVGFVFGIQGVAAMISAVAFGRVDSRNRERMMLAIPMLAVGAITGLLIWKTSLEVLVFVMIITGFLNGPLDVALFTVRQRRTDPAWTGRAFAVSMSINYLGFPAGSALAGVIAARSIDMSVAFGAVTSIIAGFLAFWVVPEE